ncbi:hypothetical protein FB451DRAFT_1165976 [Mycena latifolia]|nr:hypothetical protein FB451DRAFT_1165976 [Mycena latifolia]
MDDSDNTSHAQLIVTTLFGILALIPALVPGTPLRYTVLGITIFLALIYAIYLKHNPSTKLRHLQKTIETLEATIPKTSGMTWGEYLLFARDIAECTTQAKAIRTTVRFIVEAERQRKLTEEIGETQLILGTGMSIHFNSDISVTHSPVRHRGAGSPQKTPLQYAPAHSSQFQSFIMDPKDP